MKFYPVEEVSNMQYVFMYRQPEDDMFPSNGTKGLVAANCRGSVEGQPGNSGTELLLCLPSQVIKIKKDSNHLLLYCRFPKHVR